ncbi:hypothetical protein [[Eubacterium] cellulosolvens]
MAPPKERFGLSIDSQLMQGFERYYLSVAIFSGVKDPSADVFQIRLSGVKNEKWEEIGRVNLYRDQQGYRQFPSIPISAQKQTPTLEVSKEDFEDTVDKESEDSSFL